MSTKLELQKLAELKAKDKGHVLGAWINIRKVCMNRCKHCNAEVRIHPSPHKGFDRIKGPATYEQCYKTVLL